MKLLGTHIQKTTAILHSVLFISLLTGAALSVVSIHGVSMPLGNSTVFLVSADTMFAISFEKYNVAHLPWYSEWQLTDSIAPFHINASIADLPHSGYLSIGYAYPILAYLAAIATYLHHRRRSPH